VDTKDAYTFDQMLMVERALLANDTEKALEILRSYLDMYNALTDHSDFPGFPSDRLVVDGSPRGNIDIASQAMVGLEIMRFRQYLRDHDVSDTQFNGSMEFLADDFKDNAADILVEEMKANGVPVAPVRSSVAALNIALKYPDLYKFMPIKAKEDKKFTDLLKQGQSLNPVQTEVLNRSLIEANYKDAPKRVKFDEMLQGVFKWMDANYLKNEVYAEPMALVWAFMGS